nr:tRNA dihydrouridine(20/20a) synthase DusA [Balneatrix alpica]
MNTTVNRRFSIAPMMELTDRFYRRFARSLSQHTLLYTEMITTGALIHGDRQRFLRYDPSEHPLAIQLGGSNPKDLALCARMCEDAGFDEINLNVGCPSDRVQNNMIGACLMAHPQLVAECLAAMQAEVDIPVTVKHRIGIDEQEGYEVLHHFVEQVRQSGCKTFIVHARKAILQGLSPKENREIPPLRYEYVYQLKQSFPELEIILNGGIKTLDECQTHIQQVDGVMLGREAYYNPRLLMEVDPVLFAQPSPFQCPKQAVQAYLPFLQECLQEGVPLGHITRHLLSIFQGLPGGRLYRRHLSEQAHRPGAGLHTLVDAMEHVRLPQQPTETK